MAFEGFLADQELCDLHEDIQERNKQLDVDHSVPRLRLESAQFSTHKNFRLSVLGLAGHSDEQAHLFALNACRFLAKTAGCGWIRPPLYFLNLSAWPCLLLVGTLFHMQYFLIRPID